MTDIDHVAAGRSSRQQIHCCDPLTSWSHSHRFQRGLALARSFADGRVLDYGCGDGTFLGLLQNSGTPPALAVGADIDPRLVAECQHRFAEWPSLRFIQECALGKDHEASFDALFCMEVLEHVEDPRPLLVKFERLLKPGAALVISIAIETGLPLLVKRLLRRLGPWQRRTSPNRLNWRGVRRMVASRFDLEKTFTSPFNWMGPQLSTQVWLVARRR